MLKQCLPAVDALRNVRCATRSKVAGWDAAKALKSGEMMPAWLHDRPRAPAQGHCCGEWGCKGAIAPSPAAGGEQQAAQLVVSGAARKTAAAQSAQHAAQHSQSTHLAVSAQPRKSG